MTDDARADDVERRIAEPLRRADATLDELHAARLVAAIEAALDRDPDRDQARDRSSGGAGRSGPTPRRARQAALVVGLVAAAAAIFVAARSAPRPQLVATPSFPRAPVGTRDAALLAPYIYSGPGAEAQSLEATGRLVARAGAEVRAAIGTRIRLTLVGPGAVSVAPAVEDGALDLVLERGRLLVDYDGHGGGTLRVHSPGAVTTVVGTLFAVEALDDTTRVAVARGRVRTDASGVTHAIVAGAAWSAVDGPLEHMPADVAEALAYHDASPPPPVGEYGVVRVAGVPSEPGPAATVALDGQRLAVGPVVARVAAGSHGLEIAGGRLRVEVSGGSAVAVARGSAGWAARSLTALGADPAPFEGESAAPAGSAEAAARRAGAGRTAVPAAAPSADAEALYLAAEAAMRKGSPEDARRALEAVVARDRGGARGQSALLDLARLAFEAGDVSKARRALERLPDTGIDPRLDEAAHHLRCRLELSRGDDAEAGVCLAAFRRRFPRSPHDAESLAVLASITRPCAAAEPLLAEYLRLYPRGRFASGAQLRLDACARRDR
jgi:cytochrome c-type biogenesis protein CcmH/NrfG